MAKETDASSRPETTYVVQTQGVVLVVGEGEKWYDQGVVTVPARTHRKTVIAKAVKELAIDPTADEGVRVRLLPAEHAEATTVRFVQEAPRLVIE